MLPPSWALAVVLSSIAQEFWVITLTQRDCGNSGAFY